MMRKALTWVVLAIFGMPMLAGCGLLVPLAIVAVETAVETSAPAIVQHVETKANRREDDPVAPTP